MNITYLPYKAIDKHKWDQCIRGSINGLIYAEYDYLDQMCTQWDALVLDDYEAVMPLAWRRKWGIRYLYQPAFIQQGGMFFKRTLPQRTLEDFLALASDKFKFAEFTLNYLNPLEAVKGIQIKKRNNFILPLGTGYRKVFSGYNIYIKQRLTRLKKFSLLYKHSNDFKGTIALYKKLYEDRMPAVTAVDYRNFEQLCKKLSADNRLVIRQAYDPGGTELLAAILLLRDDKRLYNIVSCIMPQGKKLLANYFLYNEVIREFANEDILFDFEGSDIPGISYFYSKFSAINQRYLFVKINRLPMPLKLLKK